VAAAGVAAVAAVVVAAAVAGETTTATTGKTVCDGCRLANNVVGEQRRSANNADASRRYSRPSTRNLAALARERSRARRAT
jgi:hypothetical protein